MTGSCLCKVTKHVSNITLNTHFSFSLSFIILYHNFKAFATVSLRVKEEGNQDITWAQFQDAYECAAYQFKKG